MAIIDQSTYIASDGAIISILGLGMMSIVLLIIAGLYLFINHMPDENFASDTREKRKGILCIFISLIFMGLAYSIYDTSEKETSYEALITNYAEVEKQGYKIISNDKNDIYTVKKE